MYLYYTVANSIWPTVPPFIWEGPLKHTTISFRGLQLLQLRILFIYHLRWKTTTDSCILHVYETKNLPMFLLNFLLFLSYFMQPSNVAINVFFLSFFLFPFIQGIICMKLFLFWITNDWFRRYAKVLVIVYTVKASPWDKVHFTCASNIRGTHRNPQA